MGDDMTLRTLSASLNENPPRAARLLLLLSLLVVVVSCASRRTESPSDEGSLAAALARQGDAWDKAIVRKDVAAIAANMADDFRNIRSNGSVVNKDAFLRDITIPELVIDPYTVEDFDVRVYGDTALLSGRTRMTGRQSGAQFVAHYRYIDVYVRRGGVWRVVSVQNKLIDFSTEFFRSPAPAGRNVYRTLARISQAPLGAASVRCRS
jgi:ketosteroid isomerase-like protein